ncbi:MAG: bifunctional riboflavin kinase/FAD synthetase [Bacteroidia bacterium]|nr:bifunctional riboflavin kinase/FAD synthetase [Bacteroidia bacterium]
MEVFRSPEAYRRGTYTVATIGTFDGVHLGHQAIFGRMQAHAAAHGGETLLISFEPHPRLVLFPENNPLRLLHTLDEKIERLAASGLDKLLLIPFTREFSRVTSQAFICDLLAGQLGIRHIVIGYDHHFGKNRTGGIEELEQYAPAYGYTVEAVGPQALEGDNISSTKVRRALQTGDVPTASRYLGYDYGFTGTVVHGEKQGRLLGYPTANLAPEDPLKLIPLDGVYLVRVLIGAGRWYGLMNIGKKPTMGEFERSHEVYILDFAGDLYGQRVRVEFLHYLRGEKKFGSLPELIAAMDADQALGRQLIAEREGA